MKSTPIIFSTEMVRAILAGRKTQTRRIVDFKKIAKLTGCRRGNVGYSDTFDSWAVFGGDGGADLCLFDHPFGKVGDRLWVRETWLKLDRDHVIDGQYVYKADSDPDTEEIRKEYIRLGRPYQWKPSIHMPREACRLFLEITGIRIERLQEISEEDARIEGVLPVKSPDGYYNNYLKGEPLSDGRNSFISLWESIYGPGSWDANPFVWVISFKVVQ